MTAPPVVIPCFGEIAKALRKIRVHELARVEFYSVEGRDCVRLHIHEGWKRGK